MLRVGRHGKFFFWFLPLVFSTTDDGVRPALHPLSARRVCHAAVNLGFAEQEVCVNWPHHLATRPNNAHQFSFVWVDAIRLAPTLSLPVLPILSARAPISLLKTPRESNF